MTKAIYPAAKEDLEAANRRIDQLKEVLISVINQLPVEIGHATAHELVESLEAV